MRWRWDICLIRVLLSFQVLLLASASVSPGLHDWAHGGISSACESSEGHPDAPGRDFEESHLCAVTLFAGGALVALEPLLGVSAADLPEEIAYRWSFKTAPPARILQSSGGARAPPQLS